MPRPTQLSSERRRINRYAGKFISTAYIELHCNKTLQSYNILDITKKGIGILLDEELHPITDTNHAFKDATLFVGDNYQRILSRVRLVRIDSSNDRTMTRAFIETDDQQTASQLLSFIHNIHHLNWDNNLNNPKHRAKFVPSRGLYSEQARQKRLVFIEQQGEW